MLIIVCHLWLDTRWWIHTRFLMEFILLISLVYQIKLYLIHRDLTLDVGWQNMTNIGCQVTSDRIWPTSDVKSRVTDNNQHRVSSHKWQSMISILIHRDLTLDVGNNLSLVTWHPMVGNSLSLVIWHTMFVIDQHQVSSHMWQTMTNIGRQVTSSRLWSTSSVKTQLADYDQRQESSHEWQTMISIGR
jgi:hypothetical protein